jgi:hypothetical protein
MTGKLKQYVIDWVNDHDPEDRQIVLEDLLRGGCINGVCTWLIYDGDCVEAYEKHKEEITKLFYSVINRDYGSHEITPSAIILRWDKSDPFALHVHNKTQLIWWAFENVAREVYERGEYDGSN